MSLRVEQSLSQLLHEAFISLRTLGKRSVLALLGHRHWQFVGGSTDQYRP